MNHHDIPELDRDGLRRFALTIGAIIAVLFGLVFPLVFGALFRAWPWVLGGLLAGWGLIAPGSLGPVYHAWMRLGLVLNRIVSPVVLGVLFLLVITPVALVMKALKRDPLTRHFDSTVDSYRIPSRKQAKEKMEKPF